ncbi:hypothetical protein EVAR_29102_1 [Eumeta japonica]|uniref:Uncharacterized protein n=1 Tax=Eumeta variegata TaxID=151549 RepID=A0A4C1VN92_EUMVA|nr:hypothetical protein EVAR_29102_1 [Eumeta japonica]
MFVFCGNRTCAPSVGSAVTTDCAKQAPTRKLDDRSIGYVSCVFSKPNRQRRRALTVKGNRRVLTTYYVLITTELAYGAIYAEYSAKALRYQATGDANLHLRFGL